MIKAPAAQACDCAPPQGHGPGQSPPPPNPTTKPLPLQLAAGAHKSKCTDFPPRPAPKNGHKEGRRQADPESSEEPGPFHKDRPLVRLRLARLRESGAGKSVSHEPQALLGPIMRGIPGVWNST
ncbi:hypothetical protein SKAU_G00008050 [Synaphobranchus kaupii]|uniref:Uncharacterized protein n=1 Tax=Synaphobranchus kaupii TaxID=118154 RepID=A0A9Q1GBB3_SYNKA|nr:hypothetical protein SKAU_G00008050 [Synaphobranchus kaupii]